MEFNYGDTLSIKSDLYTILGKIRYIDTNGDIWYEYKLIKHSTNGQFWLSWDEIRNEYQFTKPCGSMRPSTMICVDEGREIVSGAWGDVDVDISDSAKYQEYESPDGATTFSIEEWEDETEYSTGFYVNKEFVTLEPKATVTNSIEQRLKSVSGRNKIFGPFLWIVICVLAVFASELDLPSWHQVRAFFNHPYTVSEYIKEHPDTYTYVTSITGANNLKSDIYQSSLSLDETTQDIIKGLKGDVERVTQDGNTAFTEITEDNQEVAEEYKAEKRNETTIPTETVTLLTKYEYITVYISTENTVLVRVESRESAYNHNNDGGYHSSSRSYWFYRNSYWYNGYAQDQMKYTSPSSYSDYNPTSNPYKSDYSNTSSSSTKNPYKSDYSSGYGAGTSDANRLSRATNYSYSPYESYATSIRNASTGGRGSDSGGTSHGK
ncbi:DUF4178 domain-containing protein [Veillonella tobetsuensis]|jgi:hypothetical protein|uniref:Uncharacterized protein n=1 Tax=Veillonella tobetsuensis TaxID=1110546 RepID=A0A480BAB6_9FIRM|nr:DUF4178 domain-containing protein [Veillonella tobetsuensis]GCL68118.1 hypothetical protein PAGU1578_17390 [Veillonella tobetsuensis]